MSARMKAQIRATLEAEISAVRALRAQVGPDLYAAIHAIADREGNILITGLGKSSYVAMKMAASLVSFGIRAQFLNPVEAFHGDSGIVESGGILIAFSASGETAEVVRLAKHLKAKMKTTVIAITAKRRSTLGKLADHVLQLEITSEGSPGDVAPMASVTASMAAADLIISGLLSGTTFDPHQFARHHPGGSLGLSLRSVQEVMVSGKACPLIDETASLHEALKVMTKKRLGIVGVCNAQGTLTGVITDGDIRRFLLVGNVVEGATARSLMSKNPKVILPDATLREGLSLMERHKITSLFVTDAKRIPSGILHIHHLLEQS